MAIFMGIDGGGSKTSCIVGDENTILGSGTAGGSNIVRVGEANARGSLHTAIRQACASAKVGPSQIQSVCIGIAGGGRAEIRDIVFRLVKEVVPGNIEVVGDMEIALAATFGAGAGVIVIAGTGSIAYGHNAEGISARAGGLGFAVSDEGSGHWIGRTAVSAALRDYDVLGHDTALLEAIKKAWGVASREQMILAANAGPAPDFAALFPVVLNSESGDRTAHAVLIRAGVELSDLAKTVVRRLFAGVRHVPVAMSGGVFENSAVVREVFYNSLQTEFPEVVVNHSVVEPVRGALEMARKGVRR